MISKDIIEHGIIPFLDIEEVISLRCLSEEFKEIIDNRLADFWLKIYRIHKGGKFLIKFQRIVIKHDLAEVLEILRERLELHEYKTYVCRWIRWEEIGEAQASRIFCYLIDEVFSYKYQSYHMCGMSSMKRILWSKFREDSQVSGRYIDLYLWELLRSGYIGKKEFRTEIWIFLGESSLSLFSGIFGLE